MPKMDTEAVHSGLFIYKKNTFTKHRQTKTQNSHISLRVPGTGSH